MMTPHSHRESETTGLCPDADTLSAFAENGTVIAELTVIEQHVETCVACARAVELTRAHGRAKRVRATTGWSLTTAAVLVGGLLLSRFVWQPELDPAEVVVARVDLDDAIREINAWVAGDPADAAARRARALRAFQPAFVETGSAPRVELSFRDQADPRYLLEPVGPILTRPESFEFTLGNSSAKVIVSRLEAGDVLVEVTQFEVLPNGQRVDVSTFSWTPGHYFVHTRTPDGASDLSSFELRGRAEIQVTLGELDHLDDTVSDLGLRYGLRALALWRSGLLQAAIREFEHARPHLDPSTDLDRWIEDLRGRLRLP